MKPPLPPAFPDLPGRPACCSGESFVLVGSAPAVGPLPELQTYRCRECGHVETIEAARPDTASSTY